MRCFAAMEFAKDFELLVNSKVLPIILDISDIAETVDWVETSCSFENSLTFLA